MSVTTNTAALLFALAEHDRRMFFAINLKTRAIIYKNPAFENFFHQAADNTVETLLKMVHPEDISYLKESFMVLKPGVFKNEVEFRMIFEPGNEAFLKLSLLFQQGENQENILVGYLEDITKSKEHSNKVNEFANKKNAILNILSHDLAGPLGSIQNLSALINRKTKSLEDQEVKKWVSLIEEISKKSVLMIQEFVKKEFIESAGVVLLRKRTDLNQIFESTANEYKEREQELGKKFVLKVPEQRIFVEIDESKFFQAVNNLISNAIKFTPDGGTITLSLADKGPTVLISVADTGIGIPSKFHNHLFAKFNDARRVGLKGEPSVGLGMSIIKTIIEWHDGKIWFESEENKGSIFYIEIAKV